MLTYVGIILENKSGDILLMQRENIPSIPNPGKWGIMGGTLHKDETLDQALKREVKEEIGFDLKDYEKSFAEYDSKGDTKRHIYHGQIDKGLSEFSLGEGQDLKYFPLEKALEIDLGPFTRKYLELLSKRRSKS